MVRQARSEVTVREAAELLNKRLDETYKLVQSGRLRGRKLVGRWLIRMSSVEDYKRGMEARMRIRARRVLSRPAGVVAEVAASAAAS